MITYPFKIRGAILEANHTPLKLDEVLFEGPLKEGQVLVKILYSGICGKQIEEYTGSGGHDPFLPHFLGHEGSGIVLDVGPGVKKVRAGDHVVLHWRQGSGIHADTPLYFRGKQRINAGWVTTFNEHGVVAENRVTPIAQSVDMKVACLLGCAVTTGVCVVLKEAKVRPLESVAVFGCGGVGLNSIQAARIAQADPIIAVDVNQDSLTLAKELGATHTVNAKESNAAEEVNALTNGLGAKYVFIALNTLPGIEAAIESSATPGFVYFVGVPPAHAKIKIDPLKIHNHRKLLGSYGGGSYPDEDIPMCIGLYQKGLLKLDELVSFEVPLADINTGISEIMSGKYARCVVNISGGK